MRIAIFLAQRRFHVATKSKKKITKLNAAAETLLYQLLETELGGVQVYETALRCVQNEDLREEWEKYLDETRRHVEIATSVVEDAGLDPETEHPSRRTVRMHAETLVDMMEAAIAAGDPDAAELTACECVLTAETKDHQNWELLGHLAKHMAGELADTFLEAYEEVEQQEDHHYYHTRGWSREMWMKALELPAVIPPPEEKKDVETALEAARAEASRGSAARMQPH
jgi:hypothetical protein